MNCVHADGNPYDHKCYYEEVLSEQLAALTAERDALQAENERLKLELQCVVERMAIIGEQENEEIKKLEERLTRATILLDIATSGNVSVEDAEDISDFLAEEEDNGIGEDSDN